KDQPSGCKQYADMVAGGLTEYMKMIDGYGHRMKGRRTLPHVQVCVEQMRQQGMVTVDVLELIGEWCRLLSMDKQHEEARRQASMAMEMASEWCGTDSGEYARSLRLRGDVEGRVWNWSAAERWYLHALETTEKILGLDHPDVADVLVYL